MFLTATFASAQCDYVINMQDSYGDGWNGSTVDVTVNGNPVANWGLTGALGTPSGSAGTDSISTISGDIVEFSFSSGSIWDMKTTTKK